MNNHKEVNRVVETILELFEPALGLKYKLAKPIGKVNDSYFKQKDLFVWEIEKMYEMDIDALNKLYVDLVNDSKNG